MEIREVKKSDLPAIKGVLDSSRLFPSENLEEMISDFFDNPDSQAIWFTSVENNCSISFGYCEPEKFAEGTYNLLAIAVDKKSQGQGIGGKMMNYLEEELQSKGARILIVETSTDPDMELTRAFYLKNGYTQEATIRDFWKEGEGKVVFWKKLNT